MSSAVLSIDRSRYQNYESVVGKVLEGLSKADSKKGPVSIPPGICAQIASFSRPSAKGGYDPSNDAFWNGRKVDLKQGLPCELLASADRVLADVSIDQKGRLVRELHASATVQINSWKILLEADPAANAILANKELCDLSWAEIKILSGRISELKDRILCDFFQEWGMSIEVPEEAEERVDFSEEVMASFVAHAAVARKMREEGFQHLTLQDKAAHLRQWIQDPKSVLHQVMYLVPLDYPDVESFTLLDRPIPSEIANLKGLDNRDFVEILSLALNDVKAHPEVAQKMIQSEKFQQLPLRGDYFDLKWLFKGGHRKVQPAGLALLLHSSRGHELQPWVLERLEKASKKGNLEVFKMLLNFKKNHLNSNEELSSCRLSLTKCYISALHKGHINIVEYIENNPMFGMNFARWQARWKVVRIAACVVFVATAVMALGSLYLFMAAGLQGVFLGRYLFLGVVSLPIGWISGAVGFTPEPLAAVEVIDKVITRILRINRF